MKKLNEKMIVTGVVRLAYPNLYKPRPNKLNPGKPDEYGVVVLFPKEPTEYQPNPMDEIKDLQLFMASVAIAKWGANPGKVTYSLKDGDVETNDENEPRYPGYWFLRCNAPCEFKSGDEFKPTVVDGSRKILTQGGKSGDWGCVSMSIFPYENAGKKGVSTRLNSVQFLYDGERIGNAIDPVAGFEEVATAHSISADNTIPAGAGDDGVYDPFSDE